jgi:hypothetical protein
MPTHASIRHAALREPERRPQNARHIALAARKQARREQRGARKRA